MAVNGRSTGNRSRHHHELVASTAGSCASLGIYIFHVSKAAAVLLLQKQSSFAKPANVDIQRQLNQLGS